jgi:hypothetical protein
MTDTHHEFDTQSDRDLLATLAALAADERQATARFIGALAEVDARRLYLGEGCSSMFTYCTQVLTCPSTPRTPALKRREPHEHGR